MPNPAARPPKAPNQRLPAGAGGCCCDGLAAAFFAGCCGGADCWRGTPWDWRPKLLPPPKRAASASCATNAKLKTATKTAVTLASQARGRERKCVMAMGDVVPVHIGEG